MIGRRRATWRSELALALVTSTAVASMVRLFSDTAFLVPALVVASLAHLAASLTRRHGARLGGRIGRELVMVGLGAVATVSATMAETTFYGLPTRASWDRAGAVLGEAWEALSTVAAPTPTTTGFLVATVAACWLVGWSADRLAFALGTPVEALAPAITLFAFATLLSGPHHRLGTAVAMTAAVLVFMLVQRSDAVEARAPAPHAHALRRANLAMGLPLIAAVLALGVLAVQVTPGVRGRGVIEVRDRDAGDAPRSVVSPLVDIRNRLVVQHDTELFRVSATHPAYWRLMALDDFDGTVWSSNQSFTKARGGLDDDDPLTIPTIDATAEFSITGMAGPWAPAPYRATEVTGTSSLLWDGASATMIVDAEQAEVTGLSYEVRAALPDIGSEPLRATTGETPPEVTMRDLALPEAFPLDLRQLARRITDPAPTEYDKAMALQDYFRENDHFRYSLDVGPGQDVDAMRSFIRRGTGYCEQFAGTYAALARAAGLPARVVVGFTSGDPDPSGDTAERRGYVVSGRNAHAWPEVYIAGVGWLPFEPTPGRGDPNAAYTEVEPQQAAPGVEEPVPAPTAAPTTAGPDVPPSTVGPSPSAPSTDQVLTPAAPLDPPDGGGPPAWLGNAVVTLSAIALLVLLLAASARRNRILVDRRRQQATTPAARVQVAWTEVLEAWRPLRVVRRATDTHLDFGELLARHLATSPSPAAASAAASTTVLAETSRQLAGLSTRAAWHGDDVGPGQAARAVEAAAALVAAASVRKSRVQRFLEAVVPRDR